jgi:flagellar motor protein MotB
MVSYVDVLTMLLIFSLIAAARNLMVTNAVVPVRTRPPVVRPTAKAPREDLIRVEERLRKQGLEPQLEGRGLVISLPQTVLFAPGEDRVSAQALPTLARIAEVLSDIPNNVVLVGHADTIPIHNRRFASNWDLSMARSRNVLKLLSSSYGVAETRLSVSSYGPYRPTAPNDTAQGRAWNRRVEIVIQGEQDAQRPE